MPKQRGRSGRAGADQQSDQTADQPFDRSMRRLAQVDLGGFCALLGTQLSGQVAASERLLKTTFAGVTLHCDLLLRTAPNQLLQVEFEVNATKGLAQRMLEYRAAILYDHPGQRLRQVIVVLAGGRLDSIDSTDPHGFRLGCEVIYLREQPPERFLTSPVLAPLASLGHGTPQERARAYTQALQLIGTQGGHRTPALLESATTLATIRLDASILDTIRQEVEMTVESVAAFYAQTDSGKFLLQQGREQGREQGLEQGLEQGREQGREQGLEQGREQGLEQGREATLAELLRERFGPDDRITDLARRLAPDPTALRAALTATTLDDLNPSA